MDKDYLILKRAATLASIVAKTSPGIRFNEHMEGDGPTVFAHACKSACRGGNRGDLSWPPPFWNIRLYAGVMPRGRPY